MPLLLSLLLACLDPAPRPGAGPLAGADTGSDDGAPTAPDGPDTAPPAPPCEVEITPLGPTAGSADHPYRRPLELRVTGGDGAEVVRLLQDGVAVPGSQGRAGSRLRFTPDAPLAPETPYVVVVQTCLPDPISWPFLTSALGTPTHDCALTGRTYGLQVRALRVTEPAGVGDLLLAAAEGEALLSPVVVTPGSLRLRAGVSRAGGGAADPCVPTRDLPTVPWTDPLVALGPLAAAVPLPGLEVVIEDMVLIGDFDEDCEGLEDVGVEGRLDMRAAAPGLAPLTGEDDPDALCALVAGFGTPCAPCPDGASYCLAFAADRGAAPGRDGALAAVDAAAVAANPDCAPGG